MPSFSESLDKTLHNALQFASDRRHEYATLEHLLLALVDDEDAAEVMQACGVDLDELRDTVTHYVDTELDSMRVSGSEDPMPGMGLQRVVQRAILHVQSSGKDEVTGANVLVALFSEKESHAVYFLQKAEITLHVMANLGTWNEATGNFPLVTAVHHGATTIDAREVEKLSSGGGFLSVLVIIGGNLVAIVLEGIIAGVQALRLEYYEFFSKFFPGRGRAYAPFSLADKPGSAE